jgi:hypothetical protein
MAESFKQALLNVTTSEQTLYTAPASTTTIVISLQAANVSGTDTTISAYVGDEGSTAYYIAKDITIPANSAVNLIAGKLILDTSDVIKVVGGHDNYLHLNGAILEIT